jgi:predicted oxidoreductase
MHSVETLFGKALEQRPSIRDSIEIVTKCGIVPDAGDELASVAHYDFSAERIVRQVDRSLAALSVETIDLLLLHRPDYLMDPVETASTLNGLVAAGKVRAIGVSNFRPSFVDLLVPHLSHPLAAHQLELSVLAPGALMDGTIDQAHLGGLVPMAWSPLGGKALFSGHDDQAQRVRRTLHDVGKQVGLTGLDQIALAWLMRHPARIAPVLGTTKPSRIGDAVAACEVNLSRLQWYAILEASLGAPVP